MRFLGAFLVWVMPERMISEVLSDYDRKTDVIASLVASIAVYVGIVEVMALMGVAGFESNIAGSLVGGLIYSGVALIFIWGITFGLSNVLEHSRVEGEPVNADFDSLLTCHFYIYPVMLACAFWGVVTTKPVLLVFMAVAILRTMELQARVLRQTAAISLQEAYKGVAMITAVYGGISVAAIWAVNTFF